MKDVVVLDYLRMYQPNIVFPTFFFFNSKMFYLREKKLKSFEKSDIYLKQVT